MNIESVSQKHLNEIEFRVRELLLAMRKAKLEHNTLGEDLRLFEQEISTLRRERYDATNSEYHTY